MANIRIVEGLTDAHEAKLRAVGIATTDDYINYAKTKRGRVELAEKTGIDEGLILTWANHIDLYRIKGVREQYGELLEASGVDTVVELAQRNPDNLYEKLREVNAEEHLVARLPGRNQVHDWVSQAKNLPRVLEY